MNASVLLLVLVLAGSTVALFWFLLKQGAGRTARQYRLLGEHLGLEFSLPAPRAAGFIRGEPSLYGHWKGRETSVSVPGKGLQGTRQVETVLKMQLHDARFRLQATAAGVLGRFRQRDGGGMERWTSGHRAFDESVDLRADDHERLGAVLEESRRDRLAALLKGGKSTLYVRGGVMAFAEYGLLADDAARERFEEVADLLDAIASALESGPAS